MRLFARKAPKEIASLATATNLFSAAECARIVELGTVLAAASGGLMNPAAGVAVEQKRKSEVAWINPSPDNEFIFNRLERIATEVNDSSFQFALMGFGEPLQFTTYRHGGDHYGWHQDIGPGVTRFRKLSIVVQLSDPSSYSGGNLELSLEGRPVMAERARGAGLIFPAWQLHRVTPLERGTRHSLVAWITGEPFR